MKSRWKSLVSLMVLVLLVLTASGCGSSTAGPESSSSQAPQVTAQASTQPEATAEATAQPSLQPAAFPVTIKDSTQTEVKIEKEPQKIVSILPSATEIAFALGLGAKIVGVSDWDNYPAEVKNIEKVGGLDISAEKVVSLQPDLVLASSTNGKSVEALRKLGLTVLVLDAKNLQEAMDSIRTIGKATGTEGKAIETVKAMEQKRDAVVAAVKDIPAEQRKKVWIEIDPTLYTAGKDTFINEMIDLAGGVNVAADTPGWPQFSEEKVIEANPDTILITYGYYIKDAVNQVKSRKTWQKVKAIEQNQVFEVNSDMVTRPGPRLMDGLQEIAEKLYPQKFNK